VIRLLLVVSPWSFLLAIFLFLRSRGSFIHFLFFRYRNDALASCPEDRPLAIQFCGHDPDIMVQAAMLAQNHGDYIDINLGCPQAIAKRGRYGAFLQDEWPLLQQIGK